MQGFHRNFFNRQKSTFHSSNSFSSKGKEYLVTIVVGSLTAEIGVVMINLPAQANALFLYFFVTPFLSSTPFLNISNPLLKINVPSSSDFDFTFQKWFVSFPDKSNHKLMINVAYHGLTANKSFCSRLPRTALPW